MSSHEEVITLEELKATACLCKWEVNQPSDTNIYVIFNYGTTPFSIASFGGGSAIVLNAPLVPDLVPPGLCTLVLTRVLLDKIIDGCTNGKIAQRTHNPIIFT